MLIKLVSFLLVIGPAFLNAAENFQDLEDKVLRTVQEFWERPDSLEMGQVDLLVQSLSNTRPSNAFETFHLNYYRGYVNYIAGLAFGESRRFDFAHDDFEAALLSEDKAEWEPLEKFDVALLMVGWCRLRQYFAGNRPGTLNSALDAFERAGQGKKSSLVADDILFLEGLCHYLLARREYESHMNSRLGVQNLAAQVAQFNGENDLRLAKAVKSFEALVASSDRLSDLSTFYLAMAQLERARLWISLSQGDALESEKEDMVTRSLSEARVNFSTLIKDERYRVLATRGFNAAYLLTALHESHSPNDDELIVMNLPSPEKNTLIESTDLLRLLQAIINDSSYSLRQIEPLEENNIRSYWRDVRRSMILLAGGRIRLSAIPFAERTVFPSLYHKTIAEIYREEIRLLGGGIPNRLSKTDRLHRYRDTSHFLEGYAKLAVTLDLAGYNIREMDDIRSLISNESELISKEFGRHFFAEYDDVANDSLVLRFGKYLLTLTGRGEAHLLPMAYTAFDYLQRNGVQSRNMTFLKAYCLIKAGYPDEVLNDLLPLEVIEQYPPPSKNEARYYRAQAFLKRPNPFTGQVESELEEIKMNHPSAAFILYNRDGDQDLLDHVGTQTKDDPRFRKIWNLCRQSGYDNKPSTPPVVVGPEEIRYEALRDLWEHYVKEEARFLIRFWQFFDNRAPLVAPSWPYADCQIKGPLEFFVTPKVKLQLTFGGSRSRKRIYAAGQLLSESNAASETIEVRASNKQTLLLTASDHYPYFIDDVLAYSREPIQIEFDDALSLGTPKKLEMRTAEPIRLISPPTRDYFLAALQFPQTSLLSGDGRIVGSGTWTGLSEFGDRHFVVDVRNAEIDEIENGKLKTRSFDFVPDYRPKLIAGDEEFLFIYDDANLKLIKWDLGLNHIVDSHELDGRLSDLKVGKRGRTKVIWATNWEKGTLLYFTWDGLEPRNICGLSAAKEAGMTVPISLTIADKHVVVTDLMASSLYLFHESGYYIDRWQHVSLKTPRGVVMTSVDDMQEVLVAQTDGMFSFPLQAGQTYQFPESQCVTGERSDDGKSSFEASKFCELTANRVAVNPSAVD